MYSDTDAVGPAAASAAAPVFTNILKVVSINAAAGAAAPAAAAECLNKILIDPESKFLNYCICIYLEALFRQLEVEFAPTEEEDHTGQALDLPLESDARQLPQANNTAVLRKSE